MPKTAFRPIYVPTGHIIYQQGGGVALLALPFDAERLAVLRPAESVVPGVLSRVSLQSRTFDVADNGLRIWLETARLAILTTPERVLYHGRLHIGPPLNPCHVREWCSDELEHYLRSEGFEVWVGLTRSNSVEPDMKTILAILTAP
ncbi:MAG TPA: hypothetical protein VLK65_02770 [Vicinamibacteria bacterium]|nr:hypothetical protein [Vicinamibacteria bacterium]